MSGRFTKAIDPLAYAARGRTVEGRLALSSMARLRVLVPNAEGDAVFILHFAMAEGRIPTIQGMVESRLALECQRCMGEMDFKVEANVQLGIASSREQAERLPKNYDPLLLTGDDITIASIVEDELILALPTVAMHSIEDCPEGEKYLAAKRSEGDEAAQNQASNRKNPFAALAQLKEDLTTDATNKDEE